VVADHQGSQHQGTVAGETALPENGETGVEMKRVFVAALAVAASVVSAHAQVFPNKPVTVVIPLAAGGAVDTMVRTMLDSLRVRRETGKE
jgi:hypothetical protein